MIQPKLIIIVKAGKDRLLSFDTSQNMTGYIFVDLVGQEFTFDFFPLDETRNIIDACLVKKEPKEGKK